VTDADLEHARKQVAECDARLIELKDSEPSSRDYSVAFKQRVFNQLVIDRQIQNGKNRNILFF